MARGSARTTAPLCVTPSEALNLRGSEGGRGPKAMSAANYVDTWKTAEGDVNHLEERLFDQA